MTDSALAILRRALEARVADVLPNPTPLDRATTLSERLGTAVWIKREDLTPIFSFKLRGAYNRIAHLDDAHLARGVIAASSGNHAQGVAFSARTLGARARIVMPRTTPAIKVDNVRRLGAEVELHGDTYTEAAARCATLADASGEAMIPPYDDLDVIAGQGTIGLEILRQSPRDLAAILVPVGGGGLASGIASVVKAVRPGVRIIGVQPDDADAMARSLASGTRVVLDHVGLFADGVAVREVGEHTLALCREHLDGCITVSTDDICAAIQAGFEDTRTLLEPAGALGIAGVTRLAATGDLPSGSIVAVASGANMSFTRMRFVAERAAGGEHLFAVTIPERPGAFLAFCRLLGERPITEFNYRLATRDDAHVFVGLQVRAATEARAVVEDLRAAGYGCVDLTDDDFAKTHVRHMVGGRTPEVRDEVLLTVEFPERPGTLLRFLEQLGGRWNISLFHYRNHGDVFGRVLCGLEIPPAEREALRANLDRLGFAYADVTDNPAGRLFLR